MAMLLVASHRREYRLMYETKTKVLFVYLGKRGAMPRFALELMEAAQDIENLTAFVCISEQNEIRTSFDKFGANLVSVKTFASKLGFVLHAWRIFHIRRKLKAFITEHRITLVVELMPHVWSGLIGPAFKAAGASWTSILHDANSHPGDSTALAKPLLDLGIRCADNVVVLSRSVAEQAATLGLVSLEHTITLFLPDLSYSFQKNGTGVNQPQIMPRLLFLGRIMPYKGLGLFVAAMELLHARGICLPFGVFGEGDMDEFRPRLDKLGAEIQNRWLGDGEINAILARHEIMVVSHTEASQSAVVSTAFGACMPVVATPVGGLPEQVENGVTGLVSPGIEPGELADTIERLAIDLQLLQRLRENIQAREGERSMRTFVERLLRASH